MTSTNLLRAELTVPEAAFVAGVSERVIHHEIDARIMDATGTKDRRRVAGIDLLYLAAIRGVREHLAPALRRRVRGALSEAVLQHKAVATIAAFELPVAALEAEVLGSINALDRLRSGPIVSEPEVLAGEPVLRGTRVPARLVADLVRRGAAREELAEEYDLTPDQIGAAVAFDRVMPKRGRPRRVRRLNVTEHDVPADR